MFEVVTGMEERDRSVLAKLASVNNYFSDGNAFGLLDPNYIIEP